MNILGDAWDGVKSVASGVEKIGEAVIMAPAEIAHWALGEMFGGSDAELHKIATELAALGKQMDELGKEINSALSHLTWHGPASDAFVTHAQGRVRELSGVADELDGLSKSVERLANIY